MANYTKKQEAQDDLETAEAALSRAQGDPTPANYRLVARCFRLAATSADRAGLKGSYRTRMACATAADRKAIELES